MSMYLGDFAEDATVYIPWTTNAADGGRESWSATLEEADIVILKDGAAMTLDASTITISLDLNSRVGFHVVAVDMSNDADFSTGSDYAAVLYASDETLDSQAPAGVLGTWSCENRYGSTNTTALLTDTEAVLADSEAVIADSEAILADTEGSGAIAAILTDTEASQTAETAILADTEASQTAEGTIITDTESLLTGQGTLLVDTEAILTDTEAGLTERATLLVDTEAILADTNELQTDNIPGTLATLLVDTEAVLADTEAATGVITDTEAILADTEQTQADAATIITDTEAILADTEGVTSLLVATSGTVDNPSATATTTTFNTDLTDPDGTWDDQLLVMTSGALAGQAKPVLSYDQTNGAFVMAEPFTDAPSNNVAFDIRVEHVHPVSQIADAVLDEATSGHTTAGTLGKAISDTLVDTEAIISDSEAVLADTEAIDTSGILTDTEAILADTEQTQTDAATIISDTEAVLVDSEAIIADAESIIASIGSVSNLGSGTTLAFNTFDIISTASATLALAADIPTNSEFAAGIAPILADTEAAITARSTLLTDTEAVLADTEAAAGVITDTEAILGDTESIPSTVNAQVLDVLNVDTFSEPGQGAPPATPTIRSMLHHLYKAWRNRHTQTDDTYKLYGDDATTVDQQASVSDDGTTFDRSEMGSGA